MKTEDALTLFSGIFSIAAYFPYWYAMFYADPPVRPHRVGWLIWIFADIMILYSSQSIGSIENLLVLKAYIAGTVITFLLSIKWGKGGTSWFDFVCLGATVVSGFLWFITGNAFGALLLNIAIVAIGAVLTIRTIIDEPYSENLAGYVLWGIGSVLSLCAVLMVNGPVFELWIQPAAFLFLQVSTILFIVRMRLVHSQK